MAGKKSLKERVEEVKAQGYSAAKQNKIYPRELQNHPSGEWEDANLGPGAETYKDTLWGKMESQRRLKYAAEREPQKKQEQKSVFKHVEKPQRRAITSQIAPNDELSKSAVNSYNRKKQQDNWEENDARKKRVEKARKLNQYKNRTNADRLLKK